MWGTERQPEPSRLRNGGKNDPTHNSVLMRELANVFKDQPERAQAIADVYFHVGRLGSYDFWAAVADNARFFYRTST